ncbi:MAG TPA: YihA family ribosome biogenesis GTP-binding protein [Clostridiales bacterium]|nr:YihA family ribosome biogenesis GTP-binding protein [Clostridiales bacterium]
MNINNVDFEYAAGKAIQLMESTLPEVVFSGRSNVGKSSLINKLVNRKKLARVSATPGKTATINFFKLDSFRLVDLPGYGYAKVSQSEKRRWAELVEGYFAQDRNFALIIQIVDMRHKPTADDLDMIDFLYHSNLPFAIVLTKKDKLNKTKQQESLQQIQELLKDYENEIPLFPFSALNGEGTEEIRQYIDKCVENTDTINVDKKE